jgi:catechol 2,3-dioxygenase-like lactoylglutathione lyase family enzyme
VILRTVPETGPPLFDHVTLRVRDVSRSRAFYEEALKPFDVRVVQSSQGPLGFVTDRRGEFWIKGETPAAAPVHIAFAARDRATVDAFHRAAVQAGGTDNGSPGLRPHYGAGYYAAYVLDPDGNNVEAVFDGEL